MSHNPRPIKVVDTALSETTKADQITIETAKTGKVTAVVTVMSMSIQPLVKQQRLIAKTRKVTAVVVVMSTFSRKKSKLWSTNPGNERPSRQKAERADIPEENTHRSRSFSQKSVKRPDTKEINV